jgi:PD-(D/E)XK nuclease superfamily
MSSVHERNETDDEDKQALQNLISNNIELEKLEGLLSQFNMFEAIGVVRQEVRHSDFLAFLLDPQQSHGLGVSVVMRLLQKSLLTVEDTELQIKPGDLDAWDLHKIHVRREWQNIDILLVDDVHNFVTIIENKIDSKEHTNQLSRYYKDVQKHYPNYHIIGLYLTPDGDQPTEKAYVSVDYNLICTLLEDIVKIRETTLAADVRTVIQHYISILRRHIVSDSEVAKLCQRIYSKHRRALDLIYEHKPDRQATIRELLEDLIRRQAKLDLDDSTKSYIRFAPKQWNVPRLLEGKGWTSSGQILIFEFKNGTNSLKLGLMIGPGPQETREKLFEMASQPPFKSIHKALPNKWCAIYQSPFLNAEAYEESDDEIMARIKKHWSNFIENELTKISNIVMAQKWL